MTNPLLEAHKLPPFSRIRAEHVIPAIEELIQNSRDALASQLDNDVIEIDAFLQSMEVREDFLSQAWSPVSHLNAVCNDEDIRSAYEAANEALTEYYVEMGQNQALYDTYLGLTKADSFASLAQAKKKTVENALRDFTLSGVALKGEAKEEFKQIKRELSSLTTQFSNNVLDATNGWYHHTENESDLEGLPDFLIEAAAKAAQGKELSGWVFSLDLPVYHTLITQSKVPELRRIMYQAYSTRASSEGPNAGDCDNTDIIEQIMQRRQRLAALLGYRNYAEVSVASKMADSPEQVKQFLEELAEKTKSFAIKELEELQHFAGQQGLDTLQAWDMPYYSEQLKLSKYSVSQELLRPYFPLELVKQGLFNVANKLYGIDVKAASAELWHKDVSYYEIFQGDKKIAGFYFDLYARAKKRGGAWMGDCRTRRQTEDGLQLPVAFMVCNFNAPTDSKPALLTHNEVTTLFHEFGHGLHHMLTKQEVAAVSGISGVEWDAVELPSQFMENFCWQPEVLDFLSEHYETKSALPEEMLNNMLAAKNFQSALQMLRQIEFALFDLRLHMEYGGESFVDVQSLLNEVRQQVAVIMPPEYNKFQNSFAHIFAGGYAAGYYSYKWAEVLSADAFSLFEEKGIFNPEIGQRFLSEILEKGGSEDSMTLFKRFREREPSPDALLRHSGLMS